uniref:DUF4435 domain-containing protein n=1 Tax=Aquisphaera insulae TaxID=2712864 RepID=UPI0013EA21D6
MPRDVARAGLYRGKINLWVEDALTREYLSAVWKADPDVHFLIGGGNEGVRAIIKDAEDAGFVNVFGVTDRDFRPTNRDDWKNPSKTFRTFVLPVHELENYLLDSDAIQSSRLNNQGLDAPQIEGAMKKRAGELCWWAACRDVVAEIKRRFRDRFISDPPCSPADLATSKKHICDSPWFQKLSSEVARSSESEIEKLLQEKHGVAQESLANGTWRQDFAGKEIFRDACSRICDRTQLKRGMSPTEFDIDLTKDVAAYQVKASTVPSDLVEL